MGSEEVYGTGHIGKFITFKAANASRKILPSQGDPLLQGQG